MPGYRSIRRAEKRVRGKCWDQAKTKTAVVSLISLVVIYSLFNSPALTEGLEEAKKRAVSWCAAHEMGLSEDTSGGLNSQTILRFS